MDKIRVNIKKAAAKLAAANYAIALTGAGISTESVIPDGRTGDVLPEIVRELKQMRIT